MLHGRHFFYMTGGPGSSLQRRSSQPCLSSRPYNALVSLVLCVALLSPPCRASSSEDPLLPAPATPPPRQQLRRLMPTSLARFKKPTSKQSSLSLSTLMAYDRPSPALEAWMETHPGWVRAREKVLGCTPEDDQVVLLPVCVEASPGSTTEDKHLVDLSGGPCPGFRCMARGGGDSSSSDQCPVSAPPPTDLVDTYSYVPTSDYVKSLDHLTSHAEVCPPPPSSYPLINAWNGFQYQVAPLRIRGRVYGHRKGRPCQPLPDALVEMWQVGPHGYYTDHAGTHKTPLADALESSGLSILGNWGSHDNSEPVGGLGYCRGAAMTDEGGHYSFTTVPPGVYGPPQYINIRVSRSGFKALTTRLYLSTDAWLNYLTNKWDWRVHHDPRLVTPTMTWKKDALSMEVAAFDLMLEAGPLTSDAGDYHEIEGLWESHGLTTAAGGGGGAPGLVLLEANGPSVTLTEVPHARSWGSASAILVGGGLTLQRVDMRAAGRLERASLVVGQDPFDSSLRGEEVLSLAWTNGDIWTKQPLARRYRFLRLSVSETLGGIPFTEDDGDAGGRRDNGRVVINEIVFYEGRVRLYPQPQLPLTSEPHNPTTSGYAVTCTSTSSPTFDCYRAFDHDTSTDSRWESADVSRKGSILRIPQSITLDLGPDRRVLPTAVSITCGPPLAAGDGDEDGEEAALLLSDCPRAFQVLASVDGSRYDVVFSRRFLEPKDFRRTASQEGSFFGFSYQSPLGRAVGERCGSCDRGPEWACQVSSPDTSCATGFCGHDGSCATGPVCSAGTYMDTIKQQQPAGDTDIKVCAPCPPGHYGADAGMGSKSCSGPCPPGYSCAAGTSDPYASPCTDPSHYCPQGSEAPLAVPEGWYSLTLLPREEAALNHTDGSTAPLMTRVGVARCEPGYFCTGGLRYRCPIGRYGSKPGLGSPQCEGRCKAGTYCALASSLPLPCPVGHYCPDGEKAWACPPGTFGNETGLATPTCTAYCQAGTYCEAGSASPTLCPAGRVGATPGLATSDCSGPCPAGWYCPPGTSNAKAHPCGSPSVYCPLGSATPLAASPGHYTLGGLLTTQTSQQMCEPGSYCQDGVKRLCPVGTFGSSYGLSKEATVAVAKCSGPCSKGHYCAEGSMSATQTACPAGRYGDSEGLQNSSCSGPCAPGHFCEAGSISRQQSKCPGGRYGNTTGLATSDCSGACEEGYACPPGSTSSRQVECGGPSVFCPKGTGQAVVVAPGFYTTGCVDGMKRVRHDLCPHGHYCLHGVKRPCPAGRFGSTTGLSSPLCSGACEVGHFCPPGSTLATQSRCPAGRYGATVGMGDAACTAGCPAGHYCPEGSVAPRECGGPAFYCPAGAGRPLDVQPGYYSVGGGSSNSTTTRSSQLPCMPGTYCVRGVQRPCPSGTFGRSSRLTSSACDGRCSAAAYCPEGSVRPNQEACPAGSYGDREGLATRECSGRCRPDDECRRGTTDHNRVMR